MDKVSFLRWLFLATIWFLLVSKGEGSNDAEGRFSCSLSRPSGTVVCKGKFDSPLDLEKAVREKLKNSTAISFVLENARIDVLTPNLFEILPQVQTFTVSDSELKLLGIPEFGKSAFDKIKNSLERFEVYNSKNVFAWNWTGMPQMANLKALVIERSSLISVTNDFNRFAPELRLIEFRKANIKFLDPKAFNSNSNLTFCSMAENSITNVLRSMFPEPANKLWSLDLSDNKLKTLPYNIFSKMPNLKEVQLNGNSLKSFISLEKSLKTLNLLLLQGNNLECHRLCRIFQSKYQPQISDFSRTSCKFSGRYIFEKDCSINIRKSNRRMNSSSVLDDSPDMFTLPKPIITENTSHTI